ncbi:MAG: LamG domain-containing protein [Bacteroidales bacterium]|nr:LamG domain-containing protein [Bacteroidales bacterium]MCF8456470.1 LamG domain-containing protein [Bacteroidales bacterium]
MKKLAFLFSIFLMSYGINHSQINLDSCLVAYYPLDSIPIDYSIYGIQGTINGATLDTGRNGFANTAFHFNGVNQTIDCDTNQRGITNKVTASAWIRKTTVNTNVEVILLKYHGGNGSIQQGFQLVLHPGGHPRISGKMGQSSLYGYYMFIADEINVADGAWHHVLGTIDQNEWSLWVDGYHAGTFTGISPNPSLVNTQPLVIGFLNETQEFYFNGTIDEVRIYNRVLNSAEIALLSDQSFIDSTYLVQPDTQLIALPQGWSIFSTFIEPDFPNMDSIMADIVNSVIIVKDGNGLTYWPQWGLNAIGSLDFLNGYQIKMMVPHTLQIIGTQVQPELYTIPLPQGWSIIGYLRESPLSVATVFSSISSSVHIVKNGSGQVYWPTYGLNLIGNMQPGQGYQIKMNVAQNLVYPAN